MELEFFNCSPEDFEDYLRELKDSWNSSVLCSTSKSKTEYGSQTTFYQYAHFLGYEVELLAEKFSLDSKKALGFFYYLVSTFPQYGEEGMKIIEEYVVSKGETFNRADILMQAALVDLDDVGGFLFNPIQELMRDLFDVEKKSEYKEIEFVKTFYYAVRLIKKAEIVDKRDEIKEYAINLISENYDKVGSRECIKMLMEKSASFDVEEPHLDEEAKKAYLHAIEGFIEGSISSYPLASFVIHNTDIY